MGIGRVTGRGVGSIVFDITVIATPLNNKNKLIQTWRKAEKPAGVNESILFKLKRIHTLIESIGPEAPPANPSV